MKVVHGIHGDRTKLIMRYVVFSFLLSIRKLVRVITTLFIGMAILGVIVVPTTAYRIAYIILFGIVPF